MSDGGPEAGCRGGEGSGTVPVRGALRVQCGLPGPENRSGGSGRLQLRGDRGTERSAGRSCCLAHVGSERSRNRQADPRPAPVPEHLRCELLRDSWGAVPRKQVPEPEDPVAEPGAGEELLPIPCSWQSFFQNSV